MQWAGIYARGFRYETKQSVFHFFLYIDHFLDHLFVLISATAVVKLAVEWDLA